MIVLDEVQSYIETGEDLWRRNHACRGAPLPPPHPPTPPMCVLTWLRGGFYLDACRIHYIDSCVCACHAQSSRAPARSEWTSRGAHCSRTQPCDLPALPLSYRRDVFYPLAWRVLDAISVGPCDTMRSPFDDELALRELEASRSRSRHGGDSAYLYKGTVGVLEGLLVEIERPSNDAH